MIASQDRPLRSIRHESVLGVWESARTRPAADLRPYVREYIGWWEHTANPLVRREPPTEIVPVIINFGAPIRIFDHERPNRWTDVDSFTTGVYDTFVLVGTAGPSGGLQVDLTILGARLILGRPLRDLANLVVSLEDLFGRAARSLRDRLREAPDWSTRFAIVDRELAARLAAAPALPRGLTWALGRLVETRGAVSIGSLVHGVGCSQRHLIHQFKEQIGVAPKTLARVLRFGEAIERIKRGEHRLADLALDCGYYDQAHFVRDFRAFAGVTPSALIAEILPDGAGFAERTNQGL